jgi:hypothetical protein
MAQLLKRLDNAFLLAMQGFVVGAFIFWMTAPADVQARPSGPAPQAEAPAAPAVHP